MKNNQHRPANPIYISALISIAIIAAIFIGIYIHNKIVISNLINKAKYEATKNFHDPESAKFRNLVVRPKVLVTLDWWNHIKELSEENNDVAVLYKEKDLEICGEVNAKNRIGAYVGYTPFLVKIVEDGKYLSFVDSAEVGKLAKDICAIEIAGTYKIKIED